MATVKVLMDKENPSSQCWMVAHKPSGNADHAFTQSSRRHAVMIKPVAGGVPMKTQTSMRADVLVVLGPKGN